MKVPCKDFRREDRHELSITRKKLLYELRGLVHHGYRLCMPETEEKAIVEMGRYAI